MTLLRNSLLTAACVAATSLSLFAQSAPAEPATPRPSTPSPSREQMQVRLAEVIAMLQEDDLSPEQRERALAKLTEIRDRLSAENTTPRAARARGASPDGSRRARFRVAEAPEATVVEIAPPESADVPMTAEAPEPPEPPEPAMAPSEPAQPMLLRSLFGRRKIEAAEPLGIAKARAGEAKVELERLLAKRLPTAAEFDAARTDNDLAVVELDGQRRALVLRQGELAEARSDFERAMADRVRASVEHERAMVEEQRALAEHDRTMDEHDRAMDEHDRALEAHDRAMLEHGADVAPGERFDVVVRSKGRAGGDGEDTEDLRAMIEEMRQEMREIRALIRSIRTKTDHVEESRRNALAPALRSGGGLGSFSPRNSASPFAAARGGLRASAATPSTSSGVFEVAVPSAPSSSSSASGSSGANSSGPAAENIRASRVRVRAGSALIAPTAPIAPIAPKPAVSGTAPSGSAANTETR